MPTAPKSYRPPHAGTARQRGGKSQEAYARARRYRTKAWSLIRDEVMARDLMTCAACGGLILKDGDAAVDHIKAVIDGGTDDLDNLRLMHVACHNRRTAKDQHAAR